MKQSEEQPVLETERLRLRPLKLEDAERVQEYASDARVALTTSRIPHPYPELAAKEWLANCGKQDDFTFAITLREADDLIGVIGAHPKTHGPMAEIGFWVGVPFWGQGYCTEAAREVVRFCFEDLGLKRVYASHFAGNEASGRVQQKIGMRKEGVQRWGLARFGEVKDRVMYGIIRPEWEEMRAKSL